MNLRHALQALSISVLAGLASCDKDSKIFSDADLSTERSIVTGRVTGIGDTGLVGVVVTATAVDAKGAPLKDVPVLTGLTGKEGRYRLEPRPGLSWKISWQSLDYQATDTEKIVDLGLRETKDIGTERLTYRFGWVEGKTFSGAAIAVVGQDASTRAAADGSFRLERVVPGNVEIIGIAHGKGCWRATVAVRAESVGSATAPQLLDEKLLSPLSTLSGRLVNLDGTPQAGAILSALGGLVRDTADVHGAFRLDDLPADGRVVVSVTRGGGDMERMVLETPPADSSWDIGSLPVTGSVTSVGVHIGDGLVVGDAGDAVPVPLLWKLLDSTRTVLCFAWDTTGSGSLAKAHRTALPLLPAILVGNAERTVSVWACVAAPLSGGGFDSLWSSEATIRIMARPKAPPPDSAIAPDFSRDDRNSWNAPLRLGLSSATEGATILWSFDNSRWRAWDPEDSIVLHDTATIWAFSRLVNKIDSRVVHKTFNVRESAEPETLYTPVAASLTLHRGSNFVAKGCPDLEGGVSLVLDSGATLTTPDNCEMMIRENSSLELHAGATLVLGSGSYLNVGQGSPGRLVVAAAAGSRARIKSSDASNPAGSEYVVLLQSVAGGSDIRGLDLDGSKGGGIRVQDVEVDIVDSRIRNCAGAGIAFTNAGRPASDSGIRGDSIENCRWSLYTSPYALDRVATNPGFADTVFVNNGKDIEENNAWKRQNLPVRMENGEFRISNESSLELEAGLDLRLESNAYFLVDGGILRSLGTSKAPVRLRPASTLLGWGSGTGSSGYGIRFLSNSYGEFAFTEIVGTSGSGILTEAPVRITDSRLDSNAYAGISFSGDGRAEDTTAFARVSAKGNRWSVATTEMALGFLSSCPGLSDSILVAGNIGVFENETWRTQSAPIVVEGVEIAISSNAHLTIDAGNTLVFTPGASFLVDDGGLAIAGTKTAPVNFLPRASAGWGTNVTSAADGYCMKFMPNATDAQLSNLTMKGAQANGIIFYATQNGVGVLDGVTVEQTATPTAETNGLVINDALVDTTGYQGSVWPRNQP